MPERPTLPRLELQCLGPPRILLDGTDAPSDVLWRKHVALLASLALAPDHTRSREHLVGLLWPERSDRNARRSLNEAIRRLRLRLGAARLRTDGGSVTLASEGLEVDVARFETLVAHDADAALALQRGAFLDGIDLADAPAFEEWVTGERARLGRLAVTALLRRAERALSANDFDGARAAARRSLGLEPWSDPAVQLLVRAGALAGDATGAVADYRAFAERLATELGEGPSRELDALVSRIRAARWRCVSGHEVSPDAPLVGRDVEHGIVFGALERALKGNAQCVLVEADPGMGRTRLVDECVQRLVLAGGTAVVARPLASDHDAPWGVLRALARNGLLDAPGAVGADPRARALLSTGAEEPRDAGEMAWAVEAVVRATADEGPLGVILDDAHCADDASLAALHATVARLGALRVLTIVTADRAAVPQPPALGALAGDLGREVPGAVVRLPPLVGADLRQLTAVLAPWCTATEDLDRLARRVIHEAGGNPLFAVTLLRDLERSSSLTADLLQWPPPMETLDSPFPIPVPQLARTAIMGRIAGLDEPSLAVLRAASVTGTALDPTLIAAVTALPAAALEQAFDRLEERRFLTFDGTRYTFSGALLGAIVRSACLTAGQLRRLQRRVADLLADRTDLESRTLRAELRARDAPGADAFAEAEAVAREALAAGSVRTVRRAVAAAARAAGDDRALGARCDALRRTMTDEGRTTDRPSAPPA
ncbi:MAG: AAA family ATPase [Gemmatimonadota bacterium]|nr:AAA family ATPase [Gemmatimonadota bacterium]